MGTKFIATNESMAAPAYKQMLVRFPVWNDVMLTQAFTGLGYNHADALDDRRGRIRGRAAAAWSMEEAAKNLAG